MQSFEEYAQYILDHAGHNVTNKRRQVHIIVDYPLLEWNDFKKYLMTLTWMTGIGWSRGPNSDHNVIFAKTLDEGLAQATDYDHALVSYVGTVYRFPSNPDEKSIYHYFDKWIEEDKSPCRGHILWHPDRQYGRLHLQSMFLNVKHWRRIGRPSFGKWTGTARLPDVCPDNVHDDYTPLWLKPSNDTAPVKDAEMAEYISNVMVSGKTITNFSSMERSTKYFTYPQREEISAPLLADQQRSSNILYRRNTSKLSVFDKPLKRKYDVIYAPAAGSVAEYLWTRYGHTDTKLVILDNHKPSLQWKEGLYYLYNIKEVKDIDRATKIVANIYNCHVDDASYKPPGFLEENDAVFSDQDWVDMLPDLIKTNPEVKHFDYMEQTLEVDPSKNNLIYLTNIFSYIFNFHKYSLEHMNTKFLQLIDLPNTTVIGQSPFRLNILHENHSSENW
jgi:hypothetical protein